jgi:hypothetical protein
MPLSDDPLNDLWRVTEAPAHDHAFVVAVMDRQARQVLVRDAGLAGAALVLGGVALWGLSPILVDLGRALIGPHWAPMTMAGAVLAGLWAGWSAWRRSGLQAV